MPWSFLLDFRTLVSKGRVNLRHRIWYSLDPDNQPFEYIYGFDVCMSLSPEIGYVGNDALTIFDNIFAEVPIYYDGNFPTRIDACYQVILAHDFLLLKHAKNVKHIPGFSSK